jgi:hypothetical protein
VRTRRRRTGPRLRAPACSPGWYWSRSHPSLRPAPSAAAVDQWTRTTRHRPACSKSTRAAYSQELELSDIFPPGSSHEEVKVQRVADRLNL